MKGTGREEGREGEEEVCNATDPVVTLNSSQRTMETKKRS